MRKTITLAAIAAAIAATAATPHHPDGTSTHGHRVKNVVTANEATCAVTLNVTCDTDNGEYVKFVTAVPASGAESYFPDENEEGYPDLTKPLMLPPGTYDLLIVFSADYYMAPTKMVTRPALDIHGNTSISINAAEATQKVAFTPKLPDGNEPTLFEPSQHSGNSYAIDRTLFITDRLGTVYWSGRSQASDPPETESPIKTSRGGIDDTAQYILTNGSDGFGIAFYCGASTCDFGNVSIALEASGTAEQTVTNPIESYQVTTADYAPVKGYDSELFPVNGMTYYWDCYPLAAGSIKSWYPYDSHKFSISNHANTHFTAGSVPIQYLAKQEYENYGIVGPNIISKNGRLIYQGATQWAFTGNNISGCFMGTFRPHFEKTAVDNPVYSSPASPAVTFGASCPFTLFIRQNQYMDYSFVGRYGEVRSIDLLHSTLDLKFDGKTVATNRDELNNAMFGDYSQPMPGEAKGPWDIEVVNSNIEVDGLDGCNSFKLHLEPSDVYAAPSLTALQLRDKNDIVTDRFATAADGRLQLSGGTFVFTRDESWNAWYDYRPLAAFTVEYAAYGSDNWRELEVTEDASRFYMPGYGTYWGASLDRVEGTSPTGWFSLRISMEDPFGSTSSQVVSPAFKIEDRKAPGSVEETVAAPHDVTRVYSIDGIYVGSSLPAIPGIYIVTDSRESRKVVIK